MRSAVAGELQQVVAASVRLRARETQKERAGGQRKHCLQANSDAATFVRCQVLTAKGMDFLETLRPKKPKALEKP